LLRTQPKSQSKLPKGRQEAMNLPAGAFRSRTVPWTSSIRRWPSFMPYASKGQAFSLSGASITPTNSVARQPAGASCKYPNPASAR
jgi:hypothetical protein